MFIRINWIAATRYLVGKKAESVNLEIFQFCVAFRDWYFIFAKLFE